METAAAASGIDRITLHLWLRKGNKLPGTIYSAFADAVHEAMAQAGCVTCSPSAGLLATVTGGQQPWRPGTQVPGRTTETETHRRMAHG